MPAADPRITQSAVDALAPWFHNLHLPDGVQTAPDHFLGDFPSFKWREIESHVPADLHGWRALDVGCNAGFYSFQLAARGAHVTAIDMDPHYLAQARWAARQYGVQDSIEFRRAQLYDLAHEPRQYDLVWFMGVLYHLRHPLLALDILRRRTRRFLMLQTLTMPGDAVVDPPPDFPLEERGRLLADGWPHMAFIEARMSGDPTNWWAPNRACVEAMLRSSGFCVRERVADETYLCEPAATSPWSALIDEELRAATGT
ncbi:MAG TPA: TIGR04290 family methyltransferase [Rhodanobacteraceae bacterium]